MKVKDLKVILNEYDDEMEIHALNGGEVPLVKHNCFSVMKIRRSVQDPNFYMFANHKLARGSFNEVLHPEYDALVWVF